MAALVRDAPRFVQHYIRHRKAREASILHRLAKGEADIPTIVRAIYIGLDPRLTKAAGLSVLAHLEDLVARGEVVTEGAPSIGGELPLALIASWRSARPSWPAAPAGPDGPASGCAMVSSISFIRLRMRAALAPKSKLP